MTGKGRPEKLMERIFSGKTVDEAVEAGLNELALTREDVEIEVLEEGKKGLFKSTPAQVKITVKEKLTDGQRAVRFLEGLLPLIGAEATPVLQSEEEKIIIQLTDGSKGLIGRRGEIIDALQVLAGAVANTGRHDYRRVVVDCGSYREEREETLKHVAEKLAAKAVRLGKRVRLEPMNPYERRIIHSALADSQEVTTKSEGREPARYVVITPKVLRRDDKKDKRRGGKDRSRNDREPKYGSERKKTYERRELPSEATPESSGTSFNRGGTPGYKKGSFSGFFGTFLGNANDEEKPTPTDEE